MSDIYNEKIVKKSRKEHKCDICGEIITKGSSYKNIVGLFDGDFFETKVCNHCIPILAKFFNIRSKDIEDGYSYSDVAEDIKETVMYECPSVENCNHDCISCDYGVKKYLEYEATEFWKET